MLKCHKNLIQTGCCHPRSCLQPYFYSLLGVACCFCCILQLMVFLLKKYFCRVNFTGLVSWNSPAQILVSPQCGVRDDWVSVTLPIRKTAHNGEFPTLWKIQSLITVILVKFKKAAQSSGKGPATGPAFGIYNMHSCKTFSYFCWTHKILLLCIIKTV